tara:strand:- start:281 stop:691 length:411 start_codon:yes stop_codon:yes gene_type:complete
MVRIKIVKNDVSTVAKIVIIDDKKRVLFLKRSEYVEKYAGDWDLPGGHLKKEESLIQGLKREVKEETNLDVEEPKFLLKMDNLNFFYVKYNSEKINLSHEHTDYRFFEQYDLDPCEKFQKVAIMSLKEVENENFYS